MSSYRHPARPPTAARRMADWLCRGLLFLLPAFPALAHEPPATLADTGFGKPSLHAVEYTPQYPLWSDGAQKRRWIALPAGTFVDASKPDAWTFPAGTRLWKEFAFDGRPVETRYIEKRRDGAWLFATYVWNTEGTAAVLAPEKGITVSPPGAPVGRYKLPARTDCMACHGSTPVPVLGFTALQLSPDRDPPRDSSAMATADLPQLVARGLVRGLPKRLLDHPPRIAAETPLERAALGYLHANCAHCHNTSALRAPIALTLAQRAADPDAARAEVLAAIVGKQARLGHSETVSARTIVEAGRPDGSLLVERMRSRQAQTQMPPLGSTVSDPQAIALLSRWILELKPKGEAP
jgi:hypothetical protein